MKSPYSPSFKLFRTSSTKAKKTSSQTPHYPTQTPQQNLSPAPSRYAKSRILVPSKSFAQKQKPFDSFLFNQEKEFNDLKKQYNKLKTQLEELSEEQKQIQQKCSITYQTSIDKQIKKLNTALGLVINEMSIKEREKKLLERQFQKQKSVITSRPTQQEMTYQEKKILLEEQETLYLKIQKELEIENRLLQTLVKELEENE